MDLSAVFKLGEDCPTGKCEAGSVCVFNMTTFSFTKCQAYNMKNSGDPCGLNDRCPTDHVCFESSFCFAHFPVVLKY